jgi:hypothetical protein
MSISRREEITASHVRENAINLSLWFKLPAGIRVALMNRGLLRVATIACA